MTVLEKPYTIEEIRKRTKDGKEYIKGNVRIPLWDIIDNDLETFLDIISDKLVNSICLIDINYRPIGVKETDVIIEVTGDVSDILEENEE